MQIKAPNPLPALGKRAAFLAGSIEMGAAVDWQAHAAHALEAQKWVVLNPRRDDWDSSWVQSIDNPHFREQVEWELAALKRADAILFYFDPATKSPISLLELGLFVGGKAWVVVVCPPGFWRKGNVDIVCAQYGVRVHEKLEDGITAMRELMEAEW